MGMKENITEEACMNHFTKYPRNDSH